MKIAVRPYHQDRDLSQICGLWQAALGSQWPVTEQLLARNLTVHEVEPDGHHLVTTTGDRVVGFVGAELDRTTSEDRVGGTISMLLVEPRYQGQGIGTVLHEAAREHLRVAGAHSIGLAGGHDYLWQGVPSNLPGGFAFFRSRTWRFTHQSHDLTCDLGTYTTPPYVYRRIRSAGVTVTIAAMADLPALVAFGNQEFPEWSHQYTRVASLGDHGDLVLARDAGGRIVGSLIAFGTWSHPARSDVRWKTLLGAGVGALGAVGVAEEQRGRGIGLALVARGSEIKGQRR